MLRLLMLTFLLAVHVEAGVFSSEYSSSPIEEGWTQVTLGCDPSTSVSNGNFIQDLDDIGCPPDWPEGDTQAFRREMPEFELELHWFYEYRVEATADSTQVVGGAPIGIAAFNSFGINYHIFHASDAIRFSQDFSPIFFPIEPGMPHTVRLELNNIGDPTYKWFIDGQVVLEGDAEGPFPDNSPAFVWQGRSWQLPTLNTWYYIRYGTIPTEGSADFDSNGSTDSDDLFYISECIERSAAGEAAYPSCSWADMNGDNAVTCLDWDVIKADFWDGPPVNPPPMIVCGEGAIPTVSEWGLLAMIGMMTSTATIIYRRA